METGKENIDQHIKQRLGDLNAADRAPDWKAFLPHLEASESLSDEDALVEVLGLNFDPELALSNGNLPTTVEAENEEATMLLDSAAADES